MVLANESNDAVGDSHNSLCGWRGVMKFYQTDKHLAWVHGTALGNANPKFCIICTVFTGDLTSYIVYLVKPILVNLVIKPQSCQHQNHHRSHYYCCALPPPGPHQPPPHRSPSHVGSSPSPYPP